MRTISPFLVAFLLLTAVARAADEASDPVAVYIDPRQVVEEATALVGTRENAEALVEGLRLGSEIVMLEKDAKSVRFQAPGGPIGYGNVSIALALVRASLSVQGIGQPTMREVANSLAGVLALRARGLRWGEVADALGFSLGDAVIVAGEEDSELRISLAAQHSRRSVEIIERSIEAQPELRDADVQLEERISK